jgi:hypothetical protein
MAEGGVLTTSQSSSCWAEPALSAVLYVGIARIADESGDTRLNSRCINVNSSLNSITLLQ